MKKIAQERVKSLFSYDADTGNFYRKSKPLKVAGSVNHRGYREISISGEKYQAHRLAWIYVHGDIGDFDIDHINHLKGDNRICNLRVATRAQNLQNRAPKNPNGKHSRYVGVSWNKNERKWVSSIMVNGVTHRLGYFNDEEEAASAYIAAKSKLHTFSPNVSKPYV